MNKKFKNLTKTIALLLIGAILFSSSITTVNAVAQTITIGESEPIQGYVAGVHFSTKRSTSGDYLYCLNIRKRTARNITATLVGERDAGLAYILENGYPNKNITGDRLKDYYITQTAVWWYLDDTTGTTNLGEAFKTDGSDPHNLRPSIKALVAKAKEKKKQGYAKTTLALTVKDSSMTLKDGYYVSDEIYAKTYSNIGNYDVSLTNAPEGSQIINSEGKVTSKIGVKEKFRVKVPAGKVKGIELKLKVTAKARGTINKAYEYQPTDSNMQNVSPSVLTPEVTDVTSIVNLEISTSKVSIIKIDKKTNQPLAGAKLVVKDSEGRVVTSWTTTTNAHVIRNLKNGTYTVTEESAPKGYKLNKEPVEFTITDSNKDITVKFYNEAKSSVVNIIKIDNSTGEPLAGAVLVVRDATGKEIARFTTSTDPYILTDLEDGTYTVEEVEAPAGYILNSAKSTFTIDSEHLSHQIIFENYPEVIVPDTQSASSIIFMILGIAIIGTGIGFIYKNGKKAK